MIFVLVSFPFLFRFETTKLCKLKNTNINLKKYKIEKRKKNRCVLSPAGSNMRRGTPSDCHTDSNNSTSGGNNQIQAQQQTQQTSQPPTQQTPTQQQQQPSANTQITTHPTYGEDDSSCDSHFLGKFAWYSDIRCSG